MKCYVIPACIAASFIAGIATAETEECKPPESAVFTPVCDSLSYLKFETRYNTAVTFTPVGCSITDAQGGALALGIALASSRETIEFGPCVWEDFDFDLDLGDDSEGIINLITEGPADAFVSIEASAVFNSIISSIYRGSAEARATASKLSLATESYHKHVFGYNSVNKLKDGDGKICTTEVTGHAFSSGVETAFADADFSDGCTGLTGGLDVYIRTNFTPFCKMTISQQKDDPSESCPICSSSAGSINLAYSLDVNFIVGGARSVARQQGVIRFVSDGNSVSATDRLGMFSDPAFAPGPIDDGYGLNVENHLIPLNVPANATNIDVTQSRDAFEHDGDINGDGLFCGRDDAAMSALVGSTIGDGVYNPRGDFDLDGDIDAADRAAFEAIFPG